MTVALGGIAQLSCTPTVNGARVIVVWLISLSNGSTINLSMNQTILGTLVFVGSEYHSPLILDSISRDFNGARVACRYLEGIDSHTQSPQSRPTITVLCELIYYQI